MYSLRNSNFANSPIHVSWSPRLRCHHQSYRGALPLPGKRRVAYDLRLDASTYNHEWDLSYQSIFLRKLS